MSLGMFGVYLFQGQWCLFLFFIQDCLEHSLKTYSKPTEKQCVRGFRCDVIGKEVFILGNREWKCMPSIAFFKGKGPRVLACWYHSSRDHFEYLHCPRTNPVGTISFTGDNVLSQVAAVPRTMQTFKAHKHSCSYQTNKVMGNFLGILFESDCIAWSRWTVIRYLYETWYVYHSSWSDRLPQLYTASI
jgi:hypothetical protein